MGVHHLHGTLVWVSRPEDMMAYLVFSPPFQDIYGELCASIYASLAPLRADNFPVKDGLYLPLSEGTYMHCTKFVGPSFDVIRCSSDGLWCVVHQSGDLSLIFRCGIGIRDMVRA